MGVWIIEAVVECRESEIEDIFETLTLELVNTVDEDAYSLRLSEVVPQEPPTLYAEDAILVEDED